MEKAKELNKHNEKRERILKCYKGREQTKRRKRRKQTCRKTKKENVHTTQDKTGKKK